MKIIRTLSFVLVLTMVLFLASCNNLLNEVLNAEENERLLAFLTPEDAEVISHIENFLILNSKQTLSELIIFYENVVNTLELHESEIDDTQENIFIFSGFYHGIHNYVRGSVQSDRANSRERPFIVVLRGNCDSIDIEIIY